MQLVAIHVLYQGMVVYKGFVTSTDYTALVRGRVKYADGSGIREAHVHSVV